MDAVAPARHRLVTWHDPADLRRRARGLTGLDVLHRFASGQLPPPPVAELVGFRPTFVSPGLVVFAYEPREEHYNPLGTVHGGIVTTVLDTAMGCAVQSELDAGVGYTTIELKTSFVRPVTLASGRLRAEGGSCTAAPASSPRRRGSPMRTGSSSPTPRRPASLSPAASTGAGRAPTPSA